MIKINQEWVSNNFSLILEFVKDQYRFNRCLEEALVDSEFKCEFTFIEENGWCPDRIEMYYTSNLKKPYKEAIIVVAVNRKRTYSYYAQINLINTKIQDKVCHFEDLYEYIRDYKINLI